MIMMGLKFMGDVPFRDVYIHALVRDAKGEKMSKSKGNVVDPIIMIDKYGADAFRFTLAAFAGQGRDIRFSEDRVEGYRYFVNKLWNASRFVIMNVLTISSQQPASGSTGHDLASKWILSRLALTANEINAALEEYRFNDAASSVYQFIWHEFCDWYIEMSKDVLYSETEDKSGTVAALLAVLCKSLQLLHPFMPFVTEEIWQNIKGYTTDLGDSIMVSRYPSNLPRDYQSEEEMSYVMEAVIGIRNIRGEMNVSPALDVRVFMKVFTDKAAEVLEANLSLVKRLAKAKDVTIGKEMERPKGSATAVKEAFEIYVPLEGLLNIPAEIDRLVKEKKKIEESLSLLDRKLLNEDFLKRAPAEIIEKERAKYQELLRRDERLDDSINRLKEAGVENG
ncbi:MAG TPA: hypothetical protein DCP92_09715 [Nitrospiraceae bacterium]|nr:hypothetical protein [Nitrospiraceae bacterium]